MSLSVLRRWGYCGPYVYSIVGAVLAFLLTAPCAWGQAGDLILWLTPLEGAFYRPGGGPPTINEQKQFFSNPGQFFEAAKPTDFGRLGRKFHVSSRVHVENIQDDTLQEPEFARQVLGQGPLLEDLSRFVELNRSGPGVFRGRIRVRFFDWTELLSVLENIRPGPDSPHVVVAPSTWISHLAYRRVLVPIPLKGIDLSAYLGPSLNTCRARPPAWSRFGLGFLAPRFRPDWPLYCLPWSVDLRFLFYFRDLFGDDPNLADREHFIQALREAKGRQDHDTVYRPPFALPVEADWDLLHTFSMFLWGSGGDWLRGWSVLPEEAAQDALEFLRRLRAERLAVFQQVRRAEHEQAFLRGEIGAVLSGPWMFQRLLDDKRFGERWHEHVGVSVPPLNRPRHVGVPGPPLDRPSAPTRITYLGGVHLGLTERGAAEPEAIRLVSYLTAQAPRVRERAPLPLSASRDGFGRFPEVLGLPKVGQLLEEALAAGRWFPAAAEWATRLEAHSTRLDLFQLFRLLRKGEFSGRPASEMLDRMTERLQSEIYWHPLSWALTSLTVFILVVVAVGFWLTHRRLALRLADVDRDLNQRRLERQNLTTQLAEKRSELERLASELLYAQRAGRNLRRLQGEAALPAERPGRAGVGTADAEEETLVATERDARARAVADAAAWADQEAQIAEQVHATEREIDAIEQQLDEVWAVYLADASRRLVVESQRTWLTRALRWPLDQMFRRQPRQ